MLLVRYISLVLLIFIDSLKQKYILYSFKHKIKFVC